MCIGIPMIVIEGRGDSASCSGRGETRQVSMLLVGPQPPGTHVLVHIDAAVRVLDAEEARLIDEALSGLEAALRGEAFEPFFADLIDREPELPEFLRDADPA